MLQTHDDVLEVYPGLACQTISLQGRADPVERVCSDTGAVRGSFSDSLGDPVSKLLE